jgi:hypothetical protein
MEGKGKEMRVRGILVPVDWDSEGHAIKAAIFTSDEGEYLIEESDKVNGLLGLMRQEIEARGIVREEAGQKKITVRKCRQRPRSPALRGRARESMVG